MLHLPSFLWIHRMTRIWCQILAIVRPWSQGWQWDSPVIPLRFLWNLDGFIYKSIFPGFIYKSCGAQRYIPRAPLAPRIPFLLFHFLLSLFDSNIIFLHLHYIGSYTLNYIIPVFLASTILRYASLPRIARGWGSWAAWQSATGCNAAVSPSLSHWIGIAWALSQRFV